MTQELLSHKEHDLEACRKIVAHYKKPSTSAADNQQRKRLDMQIRQLEIQIKSDRDEIKRHNDELEAFLVNTNFQSTQQRFTTIFFNIEAFIEGIL